jgi:hypothetical protein
MPATLRRRRRSQSVREVHSSGPFKGVRNTTDPFDDTPDFLLDAVNMYIPDAAQGSGIYQRPGFALTNAGVQIGGPNHQGQCIYHHTALDGTEYRFTVVSGKIYRASSDISTYTDVTPVGVTIDGSQSTRVFALSFADKLIISDGVNRPWMGTNLSATPITGTQIQYDVGNSLWAAQHMTVYSGALVFVVKSIAGVYTQIRLAWSAPNDPTQGYFNTVDGVAVDYTWDLVQTGTTPIYAICGTNVALLYWRDDSIGALAGPIGPDFRNSSTHDAIDLKIGTRSPATIALYGNTVFFCDTEGRPQMLPLGERVKPIWLNMRSIVESSRTDVPQATQAVACAALYPSLNLYLVASWSPSPTIKLPPNTIHVFDTLTGQYIGRWLIGSGVNVEAIGILKDQNGEPQLIVIGTQVASITNGFGGYVWRLTNPHENVWTDNGVLPSVQAQTQRLGFAVDVVRYADKATAIVGSASPVAISALTPEALSQSYITDTLTSELGDTLVTETGDTLCAEGTAQATATPYSFSLDGTYRVTWGLDIAGRGFLLTLTPTDPTSQWRLHQVELTTVASMAPPEEA